MQDYNPGHAPHYTRVITDANKKFHGTLTIGKCLEFCKNYKYAAVQYTYECFCGHSFRPYVTKRMLPDGDCNMKCGGSSETCGGSYKNNVYTV